MGLIRGTVKHLTKKIISPVSDVITPQVEKLTTAIDEKEQAKMRKFMEQNSNHSRLLVEDLGALTKDSLRAVNDRKDMKYEILRDRKIGKTIVTVHSIVGRELGRIVENKSLIEDVLVKDDAVRKYEIFIGEQKIGEVISKGSEPKKITMDYAGLSLHGNEAGMECWVLKDKGECLMVISRKAYGDSGKAYLLEVADPKEELRCLLISLAINMAG
ncbi:MAG: hypothetical protein K6F51_12145 [Acetatifactor sp.]|nr:hypothetical protein [Acetatifactor sp.]